MRIISLLSIILLSIFLTQLVYRGEGYVGANVELTYMTPAKIVSTLERLNEVGISWVRVHLPASQYEPRLGYYPQSNFTLMDYILQETYRRGFKITVVLRSDWAVRLPPQTYYPFLPVYFTDETCRKYTCQFFTYCVNRWKRYPHIIWEPLNEPENILDLGYNTPTEICRWYEDICTLIKTLAPNHKIASGLSGQRPELSLMVHSLPQIDIATIHFYGLTSKLSPIKNSLAHKTWIVEEFGCPRSTPTKEAVIFIKTTISDARALGYHALLFYKWGYNLTDPHTLSYNENDRLIARTLKQSNFSV